MAINTIDDDFDDYFSSYKDEDESSRSEYEREHHDIDWAMKTLEYTRGPSHADVR